MDIEPLRYGIVGLGRAGVGIHLRQLKQRPDARVVAVCDPLADRRQRIAEEVGALACDSLEALLARDEIEVVVIATPSHNHVADASAALAAGRHVVVEKPLALTLSEADELIRLAHRSGRHLFVHQNYRFHKDFQHLRQVIDSGVLGPVFHIKFYAVRYARRNDWQTLIQYGGGNLNNKATHPLDQVLQLLGTPVASAFGDLQHIASAGDAEDHVKIVLRAENGVTAELELSDAQALPFTYPKWVVCGHHGTLCSDGSTSTLRYFEPAEAPPLALERDTAATVGFTVKEELPWREQTLNVDGAPGGKFYDNVTDVLRCGGEMVVSPESVREMMRVLDLIRASAAPLAPVGSAGG